jgi:hypothetical protein
MTPEFGFMLLACAAIVCLFFAAQYLGRIAESLADLWLKLDDIYGVLLDDDDEIDDYAEQHGITPDAAEEILTANHRRSVAEGEKIRAALTE